MPLSIVHYPHPTLRHTSKPIVRVDQRLREMAAEMLELMYDNDGVGLAANQVDLPIRMFVANPSGQRDEGEAWVVINPEITKPKSSETSQEGCLSIPGVYGQVKRPKSIRLHGYDLQGNEICKDLDGFLARVVQHEVDHLNGVMFFDRMTEDGQRELESAIDEFVLDFQAKCSTGEILADEALAQQRTEWENAYT